jgi:hypothetical protein
VLLTSLVAALGMSGAFTYIMISQGDELSVDTGIGAFTIQDSVISEAYDALSVAKEKQSSVPTEEGALMRGRRRLEEVEEDSPSHPATTAGALRRRAAELVAGIYRPSVRQYTGEKLHVFFESDGTGNMLTQENLYRIKYMEDLIKAHQGYSDFCKLSPAIVTAEDAYEMNLLGEDLRFYCEPVTSVTTFFFPTVYDDGTRVYDGRGTSIDNYAAGKQF